MNLQAICNEQVRNSLQSYDMKFDTSLGSICAYQFESTMTFTVEEERCFVVGVFTHITHNIEHKIAFPFMTNDFKEEHAELIVQHATTQAVRKLLVASNKLMKEVM